MKVGEFEIMEVSTWYEDELAVEVQKRKTANSSYEFCSVHIVNGEPIIQFGPNTESENGGWTLDYRTFKQIMKALDDFLISIGYSPDVQQDNET